MSGRQSTQPIAKNGPTIVDLAQVIAHHARMAGDHVTAFPPLSLHRRDALTEPVNCIYGLGLGVMLQGEKQIMLGGRVLNYGPGHAMLTTIDSAIVSHVTRATKREPFLALLLKLDASLITLLASEMKLSQLKEDHADEAVPIEQLDRDLIDALHRLVELLDSPVLLPRLGPLIQQEITIRLLAGPHSAQLRRLCVAKPPSAQIAKVLVWLKQNFMKPIPVDALAAQAKMSPSTFRHHFRATTGLSPLQFLKQLRLQEARQLMLNQSIDAARAAFLVGYESVSQFSREYRRLFGAPPQQDVRRVRAK